MVLLLLASLSFWLLITFSVSIASFLCFQWWQMHPLYGKNVGPPIFPLVGSFFSLVRNQHRMYDWATELLQHSPSLTVRSVLFGIELYITANPANVEHMLKTNFRNYTKGFRFQSLMQDMLGHGIFNVDGEMWKVQRKAASYEFTSNSLKTFMLETVQKQISDRLLPVLHARIHNSSCSTCESSCKRHDTYQQGSRCTHQTPIDLQDILLRFAFDNVCQISLGVDTACLNQAMENQGFAKAFDDATELIIQRFFVPAWIWKLKRYLNVGSEKKLKDALHVVHSFASKVIHKRKDERRGTLSKTHQHTDLLNRLLGVAAQMKDEQSHDELESKASEDKGPYSSAFVQKVREQEDAKSDELLRDMIISFLLAGRDTSSIALSWFFWLLVKHPAVEAAIYNEIMRVVQERRKYGCTDAGKHGLDGPAHQYTEKKEAMEEVPKQGENGVDDGQGGKGHAYTTNTDVESPVHIHGGHDTDVGGGHAHDTDMDTSCNTHNAHVDHDVFTHAHVGCAPPHTLHYEPFTYKELQEMKYLQAALQETMRLYPPVPHDTKLVVEGEILPDGTRVRSGAQLAYHAYAMGRIESLWGEDCGEFRPERWLAEDREGGLVNESPFKWPVFQAGPRTCLGKDMAMLQMKCVAAALIERFTFSLPATFASPAYSLSFTLKMQHGLPVFLRPR